MNRPNWSEPRWVSEKRQYQFSPVVPTGHIWVPKVPVPHLYMINAFSNRQGPFRPHQTVDKEGLVGLAWTRQTQKLYAPRNASAGLIGLLEFCCSVLRLPETPITCTLESRHQRLTVNWLKEDNHGIPVIHISWISRSGYPEPNLNPT